MNSLDAPWPGNEEIGEVLRTNQNPENRASYWLILYAMTTGDVPPTDPEFLADVAERAGTNTVTVLMTRNQLAAGSKHGDFAGFANFGRERRAPLN